jgi:L-lactate dehydrogenase complex protein LldG
VTSRPEFLARIRAAVARAPARPAGLRAARPAAPAAAAEIIRRELSERWPETLERFRREFERVGGILYRVASSREVPGIVGGIARERDARRLVTWHPGALGVDVAADLAAEGLAVEVMPPADLEDAAGQAALRRVVASADLGLTAVDLAVAETGSLVLLSGYGRPRSTSLLPPCHVAVFDRTALVESLAQLGVFLEAWHADGAPPWRGGAINVITGPSRTADIELTLTRGVHGPREVHAIFVESPLRG